MIQFRACSSAYQADIVEDASCSSAELSVALFGGNEQQKRTVETVSYSLSSTLSITWRRVIYLPPILVRLAQPPR